MILTHEQADFDAIAAMLGANLMHERALAVLPRRMNRNVKAFLTLYGAELPFVEIDDLPHEPVETVTLVDTQALVTLRGMNKKTTVQVVDHHTRRADLPAAWNVTLDHTGACTTLFVEGIREHNDTLNPVYATLLLLGIYEDTGSLSYAGTTARDARAVGHLLEQGADLQIANHYLNPPLSNDQRSLYDQLLDNLDNLNINGQVVLVATAEATGLSDEISTIAHKIRDLLDPAALFLFVQTGEGLRLVARSTTDQVDVAGVAAHFGGGGHNRAAAALLKLPATGLLPFQVEGEPPLSSAKRELLRILPEHIRPSATVRQIMSRQPLILRPDTPAEKALKLMQRYGYEGYPVVRDGKVIGLLNRRSVDRAVSHRMDLNAASLMEAGDISVTPSDSIEHVRDVMINSGWGQVPVIDPETGDVVGIVTRTDLLKHMTGRDPLPGRTNLARQLEESLPPARLVLLKAVAAQARRLHQALYIVGGYVRDLLLNRPGVDFDLVVEGDAIALAKALEEKYGGRVLAHSRFGTAKWTLRPVRERLTALAEDTTGLKASDLPESLDLISARTEFYDFPTALPTVERSSIKLDLHRRDFTINTMALRLDGNHFGDLYDYWGGLRDLKARQVRVLHSLSFVDDPTRQLRAVRFEQRFGFTIEARTLELMLEGHPMIRSLSGDRLRHELNLILMEEKAPQMLARLEELGLLAAIHPDLDWSPETSSLVTHTLVAPIEPEWELPERIANLPARIALAYLVWFCRYPVERAYGIADRLRLPGVIQTNLMLACDLLRGLPDLKDARPSQVTDRLDSVPLLALCAVHRVTHDEQLRDVIYRYLTLYRKIQPVTTGAQLVQMKIPPGPVYKEILGKLRAAWLDGQISTPEEEAGLLQEMLDRLTTADQPLKGASND